MITSDKEAYGDSAASLMDPTIHVLEVRRYMRCTRCQPLFTLRFSNSESDLMETRETGEPRGPRLPQIILQPMYHLWRTRLIRPSRRICTSYRKIPTDLKSPFLFPAGATGLGLRLSGSFSALEVFSNRWVQWSRPTPRAPRVCDLISLRSGSWRSAI